ncbi:MAG TPA: YqaA family protein [Hyphomicrobiaceae bacterium]|nr:YqaA family protein [Hyphomicrobiaceae bacterium]
MMRRLYDWLMDLAGHQRAPTALFWVAFVESSVFPLPPDVMLIPMVLADRAKAWVFATISTVGSVLGGLAGYAIGYFLYTYVGQPILEVYGYADKFEATAALFRDWGVWILIAKGWTPFPYKVLTITAGAAHMPLLAFVLASIVARAMRFYLVAALLFWFGEPIRDFIERRLSLVTTAFVVTLIGGFVALKYLL